MFKKPIALLFIISLIPYSLCAQEETPPAEPEEEEAPLFSFNMGIALGYDSFGETDSWQKLTLKPDFGIGEFGIGLELALRYRFTSGSFEVRSEDWVPSEEKGFLDLYLPIFRYVRYGQKGKPLYAKLGTIDDMTLGNGYIMANYSNSLFMPETRIVGLNFDLDGALFDFPLFGLETVVGNLAAFDVLGARVYLRPLIFFDIPVLNQLVIGTTFVADTAPFRYVDPAWVTATFGIADPAAARATAFGIDLRLPLLAEPPFTLALYGDFVVLNGKAVGGMTGLGGKIIDIFVYNLQARFNGPNFVPVYFDATYDATRAVRYPLVENGTAPAYVGWYASLGADIFDIFTIIISADGPFERIDPANPDNYLNYPHLRGVIKLGQGLIPGLSADFIYDKTLLGKNNGFFPDLVDPEGAVITARINYQFGPAIITLRYDIRYVPDAAGDPWVITSGLESTIVISF